VQSKQLEGASKQEEPLSETEDDTETEVMESYGFEEGQRLMKR